MSSMPKHRTFGGYARDEDGKQTWTVYSPGGNTQVGKQTLSTTPNGRNEAWLIERPDEEAHRKDDLRFATLAPNITLYPPAWK